MDPYEIEFIGENRIISIIPNFTYDKIYLICGEFGPFRAGLPMNVPLWLAMMLKQKQKCRIVPPDWMDLDVLENIKEEEKRSRFFTKMPNEHYMVEAKLILGAASEDVPNASEIKTTIKDIWDIRMSKLRTSMDALMKSGGGYGRLDHLTMMEINSAKPLLPSAMDYLLQIQMPNEHYMVEAKLILGAASEDVPNASEIKTTIKDIWDIRMSKLRTSMDALMKSGGGYGRLDHLTMMEINSAKPLLPSAMDYLLQIQMKAQKKTSQQSTLNTSTFSQSGSSQNT